MNLRFKSGLLLSSIAAGLVAFLSPAMACGPEINLQLTPLCSPNFNEQKVWKLYNPNDEAYEFIWCVRGLKYSDGSPWCVRSAAVPAKTEVVFETPAHEGVNFVEIYYTGNGSEQAEEASLDACDCNGIPGGNSVLDIKGTCCAPSEQDKCGLCSGKNECLDCAGVPFGAASEDLCGVCNGNNSSCMCSKVSVKSNRVNIKKKALKLVNQGHIYAQLANRCHSNSYEALLNALETDFTKLWQMVRKNFGTDILTCTEGVCVRISTESVLNKLNRIATRMDTQVRTLRKVAFRACDPQPPYGEGIPNPDLLTPLTGKISELPKTKNKC